MGEGKELGESRQRDHSNGVEESLEINSLYEKNLIHNRKHDRSVKN